MSGSLILLRSLSLWSVAKMSVFLKEPDVALSNVLSSLDHLLFCMIEWVGYWLLVCVFGVRVIGYWFVVMVVRPVDRVLEPYLIRINVRNTILEPYLIGINVRNTMLKLYLIGINVRNSMLKSYLIYINLYFIII